MQFPHVFIAFMVRGEWFPHGLECPLEPSWHHFGDHVDLLGCSVAFLWPSWLVFGPNFNNFDVQIKKIWTILASHARRLSSALVICTSHLHLICTSPSHLSLAARFCTSHSFDCTYDCISDCTSYFHLWLAPVTAPLDCVSQLHLSCTSHSFTWQPQISVALLSLWI